ncbi:50S ribosome-binding GTPase [Candidatus Woesearchaeota archaeon]|nr:50S ribosome-binding GTPase [Candidatus Woesearchaeota archaeon]
MPNFWNVVNDVIQEADVLLLLLDARLVNETRNLEIEKRVKNNRKPLIYVITKSDLVDRKENEKFRKEINPCVLVSAKKHLGKTRLRQQILIEAKRKGIEKDQVTVGVLGYPNVGKSSLINAMKGRRAASTSIMSGHTKGMQMIKGDNRIMFLDTPGVIPFREKDWVKHTLIGTIDFTKSKDPDLVVMRLMEKFPGMVESYYKVKKNEDLEEVIEEIARKKNILKKGGVPDMKRMAREILKDWQKGEIR